MLLNETSPFAARRFAQALALRWQVQLMEESSTPAAAKAFYRSRIETGTPVFGLQANLEECQQILKHFLEPIG